MPGRGCMVLNPVDNKDTCRGKGRIRVMSVTEL